MNNFAQEFFKLVAPLVQYTDKKETQNFPHILGNSDGIGCKVIYEEGLPNI